MDHAPASGNQYTLYAGLYTADVASVGASLRRLRYNDRDLVVGFDADEIRPGYRGAILAPWPNRVVHGRYSANGQDQQLALTEPLRGHALHGLVAWLDFELVNQTKSSVTVAAAVQPQTGYPWRVRIETTFALTEQGLSQTVRATNLSGTPALYGTGPHPYLVAGQGSVDDWTLELPAANVLLTDDSLAPTNTVDVGIDAERFDFRTARRIGQVEIDHAFTGLSRDDDGTARIKLTDAGGAGVEMVFGPSCPWVQIHTADLPGTGEPGHRAGLAVEPMTCAPDAFNLAPGDQGGPIQLPPGATTNASWRIAALSA